MNQKGFAPVVIAVIIGGILVLGGFFYVYVATTHNKQSQTVQNATSSPSLTSTSSASSTITEKEPTASLATLGTFHGEKLSPGTNTVDGITFNVLPIYDIGETYNNRSLVQDPTDGYLDYRQYENWYRFEDFKFVDHFGKGYQVDIYKGSDLVGEAQGQSHEYGNISLKTFSYNNRDYFLIGAVNNCGTGSCSKIYSLYSFGNGTSTTPVQVWKNAFGDGIPDSKPLRSEHGGDLALVVAYRSNLVLFSTDQPAVTVDANGNANGHVPQNASTTVEDVLKVAFLL